MNEKFSLKWNDYQSNWNQSLARLRNDKESADITLISDDKVKFSAHKILLSSCSKIFKFILEGNFHTNPLLYLSGVSSVNLGFILDYIYHGEVNLFQEQLDSFLESAQKLEIEGLLGDNTDQEQEDTLWQNDNDNFDVFQKQDAKNTDNHDYQQSVDGNKSLARVGENDTKPRHYNRGLSSSTQVARFYVASMTAEEIEKKKNELYQKVDNVWSCMACSYTTTNRSSCDIKKHVETHLDGLCYTCTLCNKEFRSENSLLNHKYRMHK